MRAGAVVVNHNGGDDLGRCLAALSAQTIPVDIVAVDCASTDGSRALVEAPPAGVRGLPLEENRGYSGGCNAGLAAVADGIEIIGFFNPDCFVEPEFFAVCLEALAGQPRAAGVAGRLLRPEAGVLDSCGQVLTPVLLRVRDRGYGETAAGRFLEPAAVLAACGAAMVYRRVALNAAAVAGHVFPEEYFAFWEDLDLGWRLANAGWWVVYEPRAVAVHRRGATASGDSGRLIFRRSPRAAACVLVNRWATLLRNAHAVDLWPRLPVLLLVDMVLSAAVVLRRPAVFPALVAEIPRLSRAVAQRRVMRQWRLAELP